MIYQVKITTRVGDQTITRPAKINIECSDPDKIKEEVMKILQNKTLIINSYKILNDCEKVGIESLIFKK